MRAIPAILGAAAVGLAAGVLALANPAPPAAGRFVVHEWGTFSSFSGSDGAALKFHPSNTDLPKFVHHGVSFLKDGFHGTVSLETPVTYFYTDTPRTVSVRAQFPGGTFTDWFPQADQPYPSRDLAWTGIRVRPGDASPLATAPGENHYYAARDVDAAPLEVVKKYDATEVIERERFLFYRGVGDPKLPLTAVARGGGNFWLRAAGPEAIASLFVIEAKGGAVRFRQLGPLAAGGSATVELPVAWSAAEPLKAELASALVKAGLYEKEARAMVKTWESAWFGEDGARVLYVLPAGWTGHALPLHVTPQPDRLVRVMVGRHDMLTPEREREIDGFVRNLNSPSLAERGAAATALAKLGRFAPPAQRQAEARLAARR
jgi:hypothetical protein